MTKYWLKTNFSNIYILIFNAESLLFWNILEYSGTLGILKLPPCVEWMGSHTAVSQMKLHLQPLQSSLKLLINTGLYVRLYTSSFKDDYNTQSCSNAQRTSTKLCTTLKIKSGLNKAEQKRSNNTKQNKTKNPLITRFDKNQYQLAPPLSY